MQQSKRDTFSIKNAIMFGLKTFWMKKWLFINIILITLLGLLTLFLTTVGLSALGILPVTPISKTAAIFFSHNFKEIVTLKERTFLPFKWVYVALGMLALLWRSSIMGLGVAHISCKLYDNKVVYTADLWNKYNLIGAFILGHILQSIIATSGMILLVAPGVLGGVRYGLARMYIFGNIPHSLVTIGTVLLMIPGVILGIRFCLFSYAIVDKNMSATKSLRYSFQITRKNFLRLFGIIMVTGLFAWPLQLLRIPENTSPITLAVIGEIALSLLSYPVAIIQGLIYAYTYKELSEKLNRS